MDLKINGKYNWKNQPERLIYIGQQGIWHQFKRITDTHIFSGVWCEVLTSDLHMLEETKPATKQVAAENLVPSQVIIWEESGDELTVVSNGMNHDGRRHIVVLSRDLDGTECYLEDINPTRYFNVKE